MKAHSALRWLISAATIILLIVLAWQCLDIYLTGNSDSNLDEYGLYIQNVYRAEDVGQRLLGLRIWAGAYLLLLCAASLLLPAFVSDGKRSIEPENQLRFLKKNVAELPEGAAQQEAYRRKIHVIAAAAVCIISAFALAYLLNGDNFGSWELEQLMGQMLLHVVPCLALCFAVLLLAARECRRSMVREINLIRSAPLRATAGCVDVEEPGKNTPTAILRCVLYVLAFVLILLGIRNGGMQDVLIKAINICTECIGLG